MDNKSKLLDEEGRLFLDTSRPIVLNESGIKVKDKSYQIRQSDLETVELLGMGSYGTVYKAKHVPTGTWMALKIIPLEVSKTGIKQVLSELEVLSLNRSPYIIDFYGAFYSDGIVSICLEYMDEHTLESIIKRLDYSTRRPTEEFIIAVCYSVLNGLKSLRSNFNMVHRDIKPSNILFNSKGNCKICDFGISGHLVQSVAKTYIGSPTYMAPERLSSQHSHYGVLADVWSLGVCIFELCTGSPPYPSAKYPSVFDHLLAIIYNSPTRLDSNLYSEQLCEFVFACLQSEPSFRINIDQCLSHSLFSNLNACENADSQCQNSIKSFFRLLN